MRTGRGLPSSKSVASRTSTPRSCITASRAGSDTFLGMNVLLTGGAGFVGSHLAEALLARGDRVHVLDDLSTGSMENIRHLKGQPGFEYTIDTLMNERLTAELIDHADVVFHLAAAVGVKLIVEA